MMYGYIYSMLVFLEFLFSTTFSPFLCKGGLKLYRKIIVVSATKMVENYQSTSIKLLYNILVQFHVLICVT